MSINTPLGDTLDGFLKGLLAGKSAITNWKTLDVSRCYSKVGADLSEYDIAGKLASLESKIDNTSFRRARKLISKAPWTTKLSVLLALDAFLDANAFNGNFNALTPLGTPIFPTRNYAVVGAMDLIWHF